MNSVDQTVGKKLTRQYIIALLLVAILTLVGHLLIQTSLSESSDSSHIINLAGRQRMLSQRLTKLTFIRSFDPQNWNEEDQKEFSESLSTWELVQAGLRDNKLKEDQKYEVKNSPAISSYFEQIEKPFDHMIGIFKGVEMGKVPDTLSLKRLQQMERAFLMGMDEIVYEYDQEATKKLKAIRIS
jgi:nitrate/nitrite-specific signal transduction histidine kinase